VGVLKNLLKVVKWILPISGLLVVALGIVMIFISLDQHEWLAIFIGIAMILSGITELVSFKRKGKEHRTKTMVISGVVAILLGLFTTFGRGMGLLEIALPIIFAVWVISASIPRIKDALARKAEGSPLWVFMFSFGILGALLGAMLFFSPILSAFVVNYALVVLFITHGINTIILFMPVKLKWVKNKENTQK